MSGFSPDKFKILAGCVPVLVLLTGVTGCDAVRQPKVDNAKWDAAVFDHKTITNTCSACHESERPAPVSASVVHGYGGDCVTCHSFMADSLTAKWLSLLQFSHQPTPASCLPCHGSLRPGPPQDTLHPQTTDNCGLCHAFPSWSPTTG